jgi:hypothetical protein
MTVGLVVIGNGSVVIAFLRIEESAVIEATASALIAPKNVMSAFDP